MITFAEKEHLIALMTTWAEEIVIRCEDEEHLGRIKYDDRAEHDAHNKLHEYLESLVDWDKS